MIHDVGSSSMYTTSVYKYTQLTDIWINPVTSIDRLCLERCLLVIYKIVEFVECTSLAFFVAAVLCLYDAFNLSIARQREICPFPC